MSMQTVRASFEAAERALGMVHDNLVSYNAAAMAGDWARAEAARERIKDAMDSHLDHLRTACKVARGET